MPAPDRPPEDRDERPAEDPAAETSTPSEIVRLDHTLRSLPGQIAESMRSSPIAVKEVRSRWVKWVAVIGATLAVASGVYTLVVNLTEPSIASQVSPISRSADRLDRGITGVESALERVRARYREVREGIAPRQPADPARPGRREYRVGKDLRVTIQRGPNWRFRIGPADGR